MLWASSGAARDLLGVSTLLPSIRPRIPTMGERTSHQDASLSHTSSQQRSNVAVELPPPYTERESPIAALTRRIGRPPNATAESANVADSHRSSRRSLDQRTKQSRTLVVRLGCALLLIGLLVSCTAFVLALVSFSASDTQHLQQQVRMLYMYGVYASWYSEYLYLVCLSREKSSLYVVIQCVARRLARQIRGVTNVQRRAIDGKFSVCVSSDISGM